MAAASAALVLRHGPRALAGAAVSLGATYSFYDSHIFYPRGVFTMLAYAVGFALLAWATTTTTTTAAATATTAAAAAATTTAAADGPARRPRR